MFHCALLGDNPKPYTDDLWQGGSGFYSLWAPGAGQCAQWSQSRRSFTSFSLNSFHYNAAHALLQYPSYAICDISICILLLYCYCIATVQCIIRHCTKTLFQLPLIRLLYMPSHVMMSTTTQLCYYAPQLIIHWPIASMRYLILYCCYCCAFCSSCAAVLYSTPLYKAFTFTSISFS